MELMVILILKNLFNFKNKRYIYLLMVSRRQR